MIEDAGCRIVGASEHASDLWGLQMNKLSLIFVVAATIIFSERASNAADIGCVSTWGGVADSPGTMAASYPSGRRPTPDTCESALIKGVITAGDSKKFAALIQRNHPFLGKVLLMSPGGSVDEAMKIGRLVRKAMLSTEAPNFRVGAKGEGRLALDTSRVDVLCQSRTCNCASACR
jgi:hypothetical protein